MKERWRDVIGYKGFYQVSDLGRVKSSLVRRGSDGRILSPRDNGSGALRVRLHMSGSVSEKYIHRLVLESFVGRCPDGMEVCHGPDFCKSNNRLNNLRWDTHYNNGQDYARVAFTESVGDRICRLFESGKSPADIAKIYNVYHNRVMRFLRRHYDL